ncbi:MULTISPECIES: ImmA/IrrE family metallo-endopeptidase [unclassified Rathayibacter]|uniref:ImmA/IrrE family metallo-endopeptidase n=1 Tax=unclassified Rathayibacter TaxID=2609250 RepID=UPI000CE924DB|nr:MULTISPECIES: ImmA/IrrE family metallo-endopeptidase [unclassified Rathayibacter]PPF47573.1 hypothetical protein C5E14_10015 [Rathayibacter sp. AY1A1]PPH03089.1 hypothetical protein C5C32_00710 [Rathayibacter sp. AY1G9]
MTEHIPAEMQFDFAPNPGRLLQRELDARQISQAQLAARTGFSPKHINLVIKGNAPISPDVAVTLEEILGTSAETWLRIEAVHQAHEARAEKFKALASFYDWAARFPRSTLLERGIIASNDSKPDVVGKLLQFFSVASPAAYGKTWLEPQASYKRSQLHSIDQDLTALWLRLSELHAGEKLLHAPEFNSTKVREAATLLPQLTSQEVGIAFEQAQQLLFDAGVILVFVPEVPGTRISGVSRWVNGTPIIAVTSRYKSYDGLWFTLLHEVAHVLLHPKRSTFIDTNAKANDDDDAQETAANAFAQSHLIPERYRDLLIPSMTPSDIRRLAEKLGVSPSLIAGQWAFKTKTWNGPNARLRQQVDLAEVLGRTS